MAVAVVVSNKFFGYTWFLSEANRIRISKGGYYNMGGTVHDTPLEGYEVLITIGMCTW